MESVEKETHGTKISCNGCGAYLKYIPGTRHLNCNYCGAENEIPVAQEEIEELNYYSFLDSEASALTISAQLIKCESCKSISTFDSNLSSSICPYCATPLIIGNLYQENIIQPKSLLPFRLDLNLAKTEFNKWIKSRWLAPGDLKTSINTDHFKGIYIPYWTFDTNTINHYSGERGEYYYVPETYTTTVNGKSVTKTRNVRKTRWYNANGMVMVSFDDLILPATRSLPEKFMKKLDSWDLENLVPFDKSYLSGFITEKYQIGLEEGFGIVKKRCTDRIERTAENNIGGDDQRLRSVKTIYASVTFKHLLVPVYVSVYKYNGKSYQFVINGRTGEVQGEHPYSWIKVFILIAVIMAIVIFVISLFRPPVN